ncbi:osmoprotectant ABC transporter substrate-binding protein [Pediococcus claussenii]|uniref:Glycine betaine/carnitine/choline ABC transporter, substrate-binding protein OpuCC n=1 Tax=Pediococcus claussenii (strain ATCC BAA-344 / DSM 14800 / JCM 18046 / KCTC 3811 / LMG 21948 / P06) TaxID=701521 RepID=G8PBS5_PEDCP|nr:osmoprotectant ABC transporter substrate-binding protein [Pediococcus claussenii]AEV95983.1 Glycine betaine/carnitine/choline ABC transporter, substrate-binding protein OpuCC [Pediococcus claussenii ATCC BAA-344]ANZ69469.1 glycine/betaine ABC transporter substrate-binding protein [Pediococcus claussenii]ANZ71289.1 glycine/betaine ABC transporter substrate-binding protein [Pediococcus claussenii]
MLKRFIKLILPLGVLTFLLAGCGFPGLGGTSSDTIRIASQNTTEQQIMASVIQQMIQHYSKYDTEIINNLGSGTVSFQAQKKGEADLTAIRYNGTDYQTILKAAEGKSPEEVNRIVKNDFKKKYHMTYFPSYGFADTYQFMVTQKYAKEHDLNTVSDLKKIAPQMKVGIDQVWLNRRGDGYDGFKKKYGFSFGNIYPMQIGLVYNALASDKMDAVLGYSTDGRIGSYNLKLLKDDRQFFPPYDASTVVNDEALKKYPKLGPILHRLDGKISLKTMQHLNYEVDNNLKEPTVVAQEFLKAHHYFEGGND